MTDIVEKVDFSAGIMLLGGFAAHDYGRTRYGRSRENGWRLQANDTRGWTSSGFRFLSAKVLRFCTVAASRNSSRAPERPRSRIRSKRWGTFKWAKRISTRLRCV